VDGRGVAVVDAGRNPPRRPPPPQAGTGDGHSSAKPGRRVSGIHIWMGRNLAARRASRRLCTRTLTGAGINLSDGFRKMHHVRGG
jgi:hypothetical protein